MVANIKKILIAGDSFASAWPDSNTGWVNLLAERYTVTNIAEPGIGEYKILKQIESIDTTEYDIVIVSHTSPSRIHTKNHPLHKTGFRKNCDLIFNDLDNRYNIFNLNLLVSKLFFRYHYDDVYQIDIYNLIREKIKNSIHTKYISISHVDIANQLKIEDLHIDFSNLWQQERGYVNHYTDTGNRLIYDKIKMVVDNDRQ
jgi:hypothetical protein